jgi:carbon-monoxide dehydrogenase iron sulfur subunit
VKKQILYVPRSELEGHCTGCRLCELMCSLEHVNVFNPDRARIRVVSFDGGLDLPATCIQCGLCLGKCPLDLIKLNEETGAIVIDEARCTSCGVCLEWCPIGVLTRDPITSKALKCDLCDGSPECVKYCPSKVLHIVETSDVKSINARRTMFASLLAGNETLLTGSRHGATVLERERAFSLQKSLGKEVK